MSIEGASRLRLAKKARLRFDSRHQKTMLLYPERGLLLNDVGAAILKLCDGERPWADVLTELGHRFSEVSKEQLLQDATTFIEKLSQRGLIEVL